MTLLKTLRPSTADHRPPPPLPPLGASLEPPTQAPQRLPDPVLDIPPPQTKPDPVLDIPPIRAQPPAIATPPAGLEPEQIQAILTALQQQGWTPAVPPPDPVKAAQYAGLLRAFLPAIGGLLATAHIVLPQFTDAQLANYIQLGITVVGMIGAGIWSWRQKRAARNKEVATAVASARAGTPVTVTVTPGTAPNIVSAVPMAELVAASHVP